MGTRDWRYYREPGLDGIKLGRFASSGYSRNLARACCANYAQTRRNVLAFTTNVDSNDIVPSPYGVGHWNRWLRIPIGQRIIRPGILKVHIFAGGFSSEAAANNVHCQVKVGQDYTQGTMTLSAADPVWSTFTVTMTPAYEGPADLEISFRTVGSNPFDVYAVSAYQIGDTNAPDITDVSSGYLGVADYPDDVFAMKLLRDQVAAVRGWKTVRANVFNHWYQSGIRANVAYSANEDAIGHYKFVKRRDITAIKLHFLAGKDGSDTAKIQTKITGLAGAPTEGATQETTITTGLAAAPGWYTVTWTLHADDQGVEKECALLFDAKDSGANNVCLAGFSLVEASPSSSHAHTVPDALDCDPSDSIEAAHHEEIWDTCHHLWYYGGRQILASDWLHHKYYSGEYSSTLLCTATSFDKRSWYGWGVYPSVIARALLYSSTASQRLRVMMGYHTSTGSTYTKTIHICTTETIDNAHCTHIEGNPSFEGDDDNDHFIVQPVDGLDGRPSSATEACYLDIRSADQEEHYDGVNEPPQVCIQAITGNIAEHIIPDWITVEEVELEESEFP